MSAYFQKKISVLTCTKCKRVTQELGTEKMSVIKFPKYLVLYMDEFNKHGLLKNPLTQSLDAIDITAFADKDHSKYTSKDKILYKLGAIVVHPKNKERKSDVYQAIVKKKVDGKTQWVKYNNREWKVVSKKKALTYPSQVLFYQLVTNGQD